MLIAVGSTNPVKVNATRDAFGRLWEDADVRGVAVDTGVSAMPMSDAECVAGARNRAIAARERLDADFGVGLEGGVNLEPVGLMLLGWVVVRHRDGREGVACTAKIPLPAAIAARITAGEELGPLMDAITGRDNIRQKGGASGVLSNGLVRRQDKFSMAVAYALSPFVASQFYG
jgi:inosine/xanthosine triphosphatase